MAGGLVWGYYLVYPKNPKTPWRPNSDVVAYVAGKLPNILKKLVAENEVEKHIPIKSDNLLQQHGYLPPVWVENPSGKVFDYNFKNVPSSKNDSLLEFCRIQGRDGKIEHRIHMETMGELMLRRQDDEKVNALMDDDIPGWATHFVIGKTTVSREEYLAHVAKEEIAMSQPQDNEILELYLLRRWKGYIDAGEWLTKVSGLHFKDIENFLTNHSKYGIESQTDKHDYYLYDRKTSQLYLWLHRGGQIVSTVRSAVLSDSEQRQFGLTSDFIDSSNYLKTDGVKLREKTEAYRESDVPLGRFLVSGLGIDQQIVGYLTNLHDEPDFYKYYTEKDLRNHFHLPKNFHFYKRDRNLYWVENPSGKVYNFKNVYENTNQRLLDWCIKETSEDGTQGEDSVELFVLKTSDNRDWYVTGEWTVSIKGKNLKDIYEFFLKNIDNLITRNGDEEFYFVNRNATGKFYRVFGLDNLYPIWYEANLSDDLFDNLDKKIEDGTIGEMVTPLAKAIPAKEDTNTYYIDNVKVSKAEFESRTKVVEAKVMSLKEIEKALGFPIVLKN